MNYDMQQGYSALTAFFNSSLLYTNFALSWDEFLIAAFRKKSLADIHAEGIGLVMRVNDMSERAAQEAMVALAKRGMGKIPSDPQAFAKALGQKAQEISWLEVTYAAAKDVANQTAEAAVSFGDNMKTILSTFNGLLPLIVIGGVLFILFSKIKRWAK